MEGPKVLSEAPERRGGWGLERNAIARPHWEVWGQQKISKINLDITYIFRIFANWNGVICSVGKPSIWQYLSMIVTCMDFER